MRPKARRAAWRFVLAKRELENQKNLIKKGEPLTLAYHNAVSEHIAAMAEAAAELVIEADFVGAPVVFR